MFHFEIFQSHKILTFNELSISNSVSIPNALSEELYLMSIKSIARVALSLTLLSGAAVSLSACNTVHGAGQDVSAVGHNVSRGANATQDAIQRHTDASTH